MLKTGSPPGQHPLGTYGRISSKVIEVSVLVILVNLSLKLDRDAWLPDFNKDAPENVDGTHILF